MIDVDIGNIGESEFKKWCEQAGLIPNKSFDNDKLGWDYIVEFPSSTTAVPDNFHKSKISLKCQVKTTLQGSESNNDRVALSNLWRLATDSLPVFYVFVVLDDFHEVTEVYALHVDKEWIEKILKRIAELTAKTPNVKLNSHKMKLTYNSDSKIDKPYGKSLRSYFEASVGSDFNYYINEKSKLLEMIGFEDGKKRIRFNITGKDGIESMVAMSMGRLGRATAETLTIRDQRFGIEFGDALEHQDVLIEISPTTPNSSGTVTIKKNKFSLGSTFPASLYITPMIKMLDESEQYFRIDCGFFEFLIYPLASKMTCNFSIKGNEPVSLLDLKRRYEALQLMTNASEVYQLGIDFPEYKTSQAQAGVDVCLENLDEVINALSCALKVCYRFDIDPNVEVEAEGILNQKNTLALLSEGEVGNYWFKAVFEVDEKCDLPREAVCVNWFNVVLGDCEILVVYSLKGKASFSEDRKVVINSKDYKEEKIMVFKRGEDKIKAGLNEEINKIHEKYNEQDCQFFWDRSLNADDEKR